MSAGSLLGMSEQMDLPPTTGVVQVDEALAELAPLLGGPLDEQVAALEHAQDRLRRALDVDGPVATATA